jgi:cation diffusion facilitator family transporter
MVAGAGSTSLLGPLDRYTAVFRVLARVLLLNLAVAGAKLVLGYATGAVSMISDGFHSLADSASNIMGMVGLRASRKPPDEDHPYGHRKFETLAAGGIAFFLVLVVVEVGRTALERLRGSAPAEVTTLSFAVMVVTMIVNLIVVRYEAGRGRALGSEILLADSMHTRSDIYTSCGVLISLIAVRAGYPILDPIGGLVIAVFIARTGYTIALQTTSVLADRVVMAEEDIRSVVMAVPEVLGCHHIRSRGSADYTFLDLHVWFAADTTLFEAHRLSHVVKDRLLERFPHIADAIIHLEPPPPGAIGSRQ